MPRYSDYPEFRPNLTPAQIFKKGAFGGTYWRQINSKVTGKCHKANYKKYAGMKDIPASKMTKPWKEYDVQINKYKVRSGQTLQAWENQGWIKKSHPYGWVQWYCEFHSGKRGPDDRRQIDRWLAFAGPKGRFRVRLINMIKKKKTKYNDFTVSPVIRQGLLHWGFELKASHMN